MTVTANIEFIRRPDEYVVTIKAGEWLVGGTRAYKLEVIDLGGEFSIEARNEHGHFIGVYNVETVSVSDAEDFEHLKAKVEEGRA